jgi:hypothetical protein
MRSIWFALCVLTVLIASAQTYPDQGGAQISKPFKRKVTGAVCFTGTGKIAGSAFFNFPTQVNKVLSFTIGPAAPGQEKNDQFTGPGTYSNVGIFIKPEDGDSVFGHGQIVVNDDGRTGTFTFKTKPSSDDEDDDDDDSAASGTWDCGRKLKH